MKKVLLGTALAISTAFGAHAADAGAPAPFKFLLGAGLTFGGDTLITVPFTDGSHDDIKAGGLVQLYGGGEYQFNDKFALQATVGYHVNDTRAASNGSVRFTRIPVDVLGLYSITDKVRLGAGAQFVSGAELKGSGAADNVSQKYDSTVGAIVEGEYLFTPHLGLKLRYVAEKYKPRDGGEKIDGSHGGVLFSYYF
ncbi:MAG TPA: outer membrane beta-barrel protein [Burkholderiaceae bacterium]